MTIYNWSEETVTQLKELKYQYLIIGNETCPTTAKKHLQVYVYFKNAISFKSLKKQFPTDHIEASKGTPIQNKTYCSKEDVLFEEGTLPEQGKRSDIEVCREIVQSGAGMREVVNNCQSVQGMRIAEAYLKYHEKPRKWKPTVQWFYGESRSGKTREAYEILGDDCYTCLNTGKWFEGYDAHENVLIDDIRKSFMPYDEFIKLLDRYAFRVECKGSSRQFLAKKIIITSCYHPEDVWKNREDIKQLLGRLDEIRLFGNYFFDANGDASISPQEAKPSKGISAEGLGNGDLDEIL